MFDNVIKQFSIHTNIYRKVDSNMSDSKQSEEVNISQGKKPSEAKGVLNKVIQVLKKMEIETWIGGIAGLVAVIAIIFEIGFNGFTSAAISAGVKDFSTTFVAVIVLIVAVRKLKPKKMAETYEQVLEEELDRWVKHFDPLIQKIKNLNPGDPVQYNMITNHDYLFSLPKGKTIDDMREEASCKGPGKAAGLFLDLPDEKHSRRLFFHLNDSTFKKRRNAEINSESIKRELSQAFSKCIDDNFGDFCKAMATDGGRGITVSIHKDLSTSDQARELVRLIEFVMYLYILAA